MKANADVSTCPCMGPGTPRSIGTSIARNIWSPSVSDKGGGSPCIFCSEDDGIRVFMHGDDYAASGPSSSLKRMSQQLEKQYKCKVQIIGPSEQDEKQVKVLNGVVSWHGGTEADHHL